MCWVAQLRGDGLCVRRWLVVTTRLRWHRHLQPLAEATRQNVPGSTEKEEKQCCVMIMSLGLYRGGLGPALLMRLMRSWLSCIWSAIGTSLACELRACSLLLSLLIAQSGLHCRVPLYPRGHLWPTFLFSSRPLVRFLSTSLRR